MAVLRAGVAMLGLPTGWAGLFGRAVLGRAELRGAELRLGAAVLGAVVGAGAEPERALVAGALVVAMAVGAARWLGLAFAASLPVLAGFTAFGRRIALEMISRFTLAAGLRLLGDERHGTDVGGILRERRAWDLGAAAGDGRVVGFGGGFVVGWRYSPAPLRDHFFEHRIGTIRPVSGGSTGERAVADVVVPVGCPLSIIHRALLGRLP